MASGKHKGKNTVLKNRRRGGCGKKRFKSKMKAMNEIMRIREKGVRRERNYYRCALCDAYHLTKRGGTPAF